MFFFDLLEREVREREEEGKKTGEFIILKKNNLYLGICCS
jgi:hypothetical protein